MFKLFVLAAVLAVAAAAPGGWTGVPVSWGHGPIVAPQVISHAVPHVATHVVHQPVSHVAAHVVHHPIVAHVPIAPVVRTAPIVTKTVLVGHGHGHGHGWAAAPVWGH